MSRAALAELIYWGTVGISVAVILNTAWVISRAEPGSGVTVRPAVLDSPLRPDHPITGRFNIANNTGRMIWIKRAGISYTWLGWKEPPDRIYPDALGEFLPCSRSDEPETELPPGEAAWCFQQVQPLPTQTDLDGLKRAPIPLWLAVFITYRNEAGVIRHAQSCQLYSPASGRFIAGGRPSCTWFD